jgi:hypothetical protein
MLFVPRNRRSLLGLIRVKRDFLGFHLLYQFVGSANRLRVDNVYFDPAVAGNRRVDLDAPVTHSGPALARGCCR